MFVNYISINLGRKKKNNGHVKTHRDTQRECHKMMTAATKQGMQKFATKLPKAKMRKKGLPCRFQRDHDPADSLIQISNLQTFKTINFCLSYSVCGPLFTEPQKTHTHSMRSDLLFPFKSLQPGAKVKIFRGHP